MIHEFISVFDHDQMNHEVWCCLSKRLEKTSTSETDKLNAKRYSKRFLTVKNRNRNKEVKAIRLNEGEFNGILNFLKMKTNGRLEQEVRITASSTYTWSKLPRSVTNYEANQKNFFVTNNRPNSWIKFEFLNKKVNPTSYTIKSR